MKETEKFSYFKRGVTKVIPLMEMSLDAIYAMIRSTRLKEVTEKIRLGTADKTKDLPSACFSGTFKSRGISGLIQYSGLICLDVDKLDFPDLFKERLSMDTFLNPVLLFISPRGHGLKIIIRVRGAVCEKHGLYFDLLAHYLKAAYGIEIDASGRDISRLCFLCHDPEPFFFEDGFVTADALLKLIPAINPENHCRDARQCVSSLHEGATSFVNGDTPQCVSADDPATSFLSAINGEGYKKSAVSPDCTPQDPVSDQLNKISAVHNMAEDALIRHGWKQKKGILWLRPGKTLKENHSATYKLYNGIYFLHNFSTSAPHFLVDKSYTDVGIICELDYNGNFKRCISDLAGRFLQHDHAIS